MPVAMSILFTSRKYIDMKMTAFVSMNKLNGSGRVTEVRAPSMASPSE